MNIKRDYSKSLIYSDIAVKSKPLKNIKDTEVAFRLGFTKYLDN